MDAYLRLNIQTSYDQVCEASAISQVALLTS